MNLKIGTLGYFFNFITPKLYILLWGPAKPYKCDSNRWFAELLKRPTCALLIFLGNIKGSWIFLIEKILAFEALFLHIIALHNPMYSLHILLYKFWGEWYAITLSFSLSLMFTNLNHN